MLYYLLHIPSGDSTHGFRGEVANGMRQLHIGMSLHTFGAELKHCGVFEGPGDDDRGRDAAFFKFNRVMHTAQRARTSATNSGNGHLYFPGHVVEKAWCGGFRVVFLPA